MKPDNLKDLYVHQLRDLYSAETQLIDALPTMVEEASHPQLKQAFQSHLDQTRRQKERLERVFEMIGTKPTGQTCRAMEGLVKEAKSFVKESRSFFGSDAPPEVIDAGLIAQAQRVEHYEISGYGTVATYAETLGRTQEHDILGQTLQEEKQTDQTLTRLAEQLINPAAATHR